MLTYLEVWASIGKAGTNSEGGQRSCTCGGQGQTDRAVGYSFLRYVLRFNSLSSGSWKGWLIMGGVKKFRPTEKGTLRVS